MTTRKLYLLTVAVVIGGYLWVGLNAAQAPWVEGERTPCLIKNVSGVPCPSCGATRSVLAAVDGHFAEAALLNPLGFVLLGIMIILPLWLLRDALSRDAGLWRFYGRLNHTLARPGARWALGLLVLLNWGWNIAKGL